MSGKVTGWTVNGVTGFNPGTYTGGLAGIVDQGTSDSRYTGALVMGSHQTGGAFGSAGRVLRVTTSGEVQSNSSYVGGVAGLVGTINHSSSSANVRGQNDTVGGLAGNVNGGTSSNNFATGEVTGLNGGYASTYTGGLIGYTNQQIRNSYATGMVKGGHRTGGLVGTIDNDIYDSYATGQVFGNSSWVGGLAGFANAIYSSYATGNVEGGSGTVGGLAGYTYQSINSRASGNVKGGDSTGGLIGYGGNWTINTSYATGNVVGTSRVGGLIGNYTGGSLTTSYATGTVTGTQERVGGLFGETGGGTVTASYATGAVTASSSPYVGGFVGYNNSDISNSYTTSTVSSFRLREIILGHQLALAVQEMREDNGARIKDFRLEPPIEAQRQGGPRPDSICLQRTAQQLYPRRKLDRGGIGPQAVMDLGDDPLEIRPQAVDLVHVEDPRGVLAETVAHLQPVPEVIGHVVAAEGLHRERVAPEVSHGADVGRGGLR
jgi:hypothetical protein